MKSKEAKLIINKVYTLNSPGQKFIWEMIVGNDKILGNSFKILHRCSYKDKSKCRQSAIRISKRLGLSIIKEL